MYEVASGILIAAAIMATFLAGGALLAKGEGGFVEAWIGLGLIVGASFAAYQCIAAA